MNRELVYAFVRTAFAFLLVLILARIMGRKLISQMTFFDFVVGVTLGATTSNLALNAKGIGPTATIVLISLTFLTVITDLLHIKYFKFRKFTDSEPVTVISNGKIVTENLKKVRLTLNEMLMLLREEKIFNISDVEFALLEADGKLSVLPKSQKQPLTPQDLNIATIYKGLSRDFIMDGEILFENLQESQLDEPWLTGQIRLAGFNSPREIFYAGLDTTGNLYISAKKNGKERPGQYGID
jgi:uncharacterized membrane protein YcaP (DUF421 family)